MDAGEELLDDSPMDRDVVPSPYSSKRTRFQPKYKGNGEVKAEPSPLPLQAPTPAPHAVESISHVDKMEPSKDSSVPGFNGVIAAAMEEESSSMDVEEEGEDVVVKEIDVYINPSIDVDTKLFDMQYPLRPSWRPYDMNERCNEVKVKPKLSQFQIQLRLDVDNAENYDKQVDDNLMITTQTLVSSSKSFANEFAVGFLRGNRFYVNPLHAIVQFRPSLAHVDGVEQAKQDDHHLESNLKPVGNLKESLKVPNNKGKVMQDDKKETNEHINIDEPWVLLEYHASDSPASCMYRERTLTEAMNTASAMKPSEYVHSHGSSRMRKTTVPSIRYLLTLPLEDRLKQWFSKGPQVNRFVALLYLAPNDSVDDVLRLLQHHADLVQGLWVSKSSLLYDGLAAMYRDYILLQFSKKHAVPDSKLKVVRPDDLRKGLLKPLAIERPSLKDWKFKEDTDLSFIKQYPQIVKEQEHAWSIREKEILESLPGGGRSIASLSRSSINLGTSSKAPDSSVVATLPTKDQETLAKAILELLQLHKVLSLNSIVQELQGKSNASLTEIKNVADQIAFKVHDLYVLKSLGKPALDQLRNVVIAYFIAKGRYVRVKKQEIKIAAQLRLKRDVSDAEYVQVMNELCISCGASWMFKTGALE